MQTDMQVVPLTSLPMGASARLHAAELSREDCALLRALGLTDQCRLRICKTGEPCIVQVRTARIGLAASVAHKIFVLPEAEA
jgi:Fe2+ transport system protein FeoA